MTEAHEKHFQSSSLGNEDKHAEFCCALTWAPHSAPCCIHKATGETPPNKDITWYQTRYAACLTTIYFLDYSCFLKILINYASIFSTGSEQMFFMLPLPIQPPALCLRASCHLSSHHPAVGNPCWEGAEALGGRAGGAPGAVIIRFNHRTLIRAKQHRAAWSICCPCPKYLEEEIYWGSDEARGSAHLPVLWARRNKTKRNKHKGRSSVWCSFQLPNKRALTAYKRSLTRNMKEVNADWGTVRLKRIYRLSDRAREVS